MAFRARVLVSGAGGFIGHHLVRSLVLRGYWVRGVDLALPRFEASRAHAFEILDLRRQSDCLQATRGVDEVYHLAANMGGMLGLSGDQAKRMPMTVIGTPEQWVAELKRREREWGVKHYIMSGFGGPQTAERFAREIAPKV